MKLCAACARFLRTDATECPFCERQARAPAAALALSLTAGIALVGCTEDKQTATSSTSSTSETTAGGTTVFADSDFLPTTSYGGPGPESESAGPPPGTTSTTGTTDATTSSTTGATTSSTTDATTSSTDATTSSATDASSSST